MNWWRRRRWWKKSTSIFNDHRTFSSRIKENRKFDAIQMQNNLKINIKQPNHHRYSVQCSVVYCFIMIKEILTDWCSSFKSCCVLIILIKFSFEIFCNSNGFVSFCVRIKWICKSKFFAEFYSVCSTFFMGWWNNVVFMRI